MFRPAAKQALYKSKLYINVLLPALEWVHQVISVQGRRGKPCGEGAAHCVGSHATCLWHQNGFETGYSSMSHPYGVLPSPFRWSTA